MAQFIVEGGHRLSGSIRPTGNKNEALPILCAALLCNENVTISNVPRIEDVKTLLLIMEELGVALSLTDKNERLINASGVFSKDPNPDLCSQIRGSFLLMIPLLHRFGYAKIPIPGGDNIGRRRLDTHFLTLEKMGVEIELEQGFYIFRCKEFKAQDIFLDEASVMATENAIMATVIATGKSTIYNAACEPHVQNLCHLLNSMGAHISGISSNLLTIEGGHELHGTHHDIAPDHTEIGSLIGLSAVTHSELTLLECAQVKMGLVPLFFKKLGISFHIQGNDIVIPGDQELKIVSDRDKAIPKIDDAPWPGFPADLTSIMTVVATQCVGQILIFEKLFESRLFWVDKLIAMGARIVLCDPHRAIVSGPSHLHGSVMNSPDIRAGMALLIAAMCAEGVSEIHNIQQIDRGYEDIDQRLNLLGAKIQRI